MESNSNINSAQIQNDEITLKQLVIKVRELNAYMQSRWKIIVAVGILGGFVGLTYASLKKTLYNASCTFVLDEGKSGGGISQYAGLAAMAGVSVGGASEGLFQGDNILELYKSRRMLQKTLLSVGQFGTGEDILINRYIQIKNLRERWARVASLKDLNFKIPVNEFSRSHDSIMAVIIADINKNYLNVSKPDKKLGIIEVDVTFEDEEFAKNFNDQVVKNVNAFYLETKTKKQHGNIVILKRQVDSVRAVLYSSIGGAAASLDANPNANAALQSLKVSSQRKQVDVQANTAIYSEAVKNLEIARLAALQDAPLIQVIDEAIYPLRRISVGKLKGSLIGSVAGVIIIYVLLLFSYLLKSLK